MTRSSILGFLGAWWKWLIGLAMTLVLLSAVGLVLYHPLQQLRAVRRLESQGVEINFANYMDAQGKEIKSWTWMEEVLLPREAYVQAQMLDFRRAHTLPVNEVDALSTLRDLKCINLAGTKAGDADVAVVARVPTVVQLVLKGTQVTDACVVDLGRMNLYSLDIGNTAISSTAEAEIRKRLPECKIKDLTHLWPRHRGVLP